MANHIHVKFDAMLREAYELSKEYQEGRVAYRKRCQEIDGLFKKALFEAYGVENNPKAQRAYDLAWDDSHSSGYRGIEDKFEDLVDLTLLSGKSHML